MLNTRKDGGLLYYKEILKFNYGNALKEAKIEYEKETNEFNAKH